MKVLNGSSRAWLLLALLLALAVALAACDNLVDDPEDDLPDDMIEQVEEPADDPPTPEPAEPVTDDEPATEEDDDADDQQAEPDPTATPEPEADPTPVPDDDEADDETGATPQSVLVYLVRDEEIAAASRDIAGTPQVATGAINELLTGTTPYEEDQGMSSEVPFETRLLAISIQDDGTAVVDLSGDFQDGGGSFSMQMRVAQIVFTLTQFDTVDRVQILIDGQSVEAIGGEGVMVNQPLARADFEDLSPAILLESPTPGEEVRSPIELRGTSNTFEATMQIEIIDGAGEVIYEDFATATSGSGTRGTFNVSIDVDIQNEGFGSIIMYEESAEDGSRINEIEIPVDFRN
jgi:germination protein M